MVGGVWRGKEVRGGVGLPGRIGWGRAVGYRDGLFGLTVGCLVADGGKVTVTRVGGNMDIIMLVWGVWGCMCGD